MTSGDFTTIQVDAREMRNNPDLESYFYDLDHILEEVENMENLVPFDFVQDNAGIERKRIDDFMKSVKGSKTSKHSIWDQCNRMVAQQDEILPYIIIEGMGGDIDLDSWLMNQGYGTYKQYYGAIGSITTRYRIPVIYTHNQEWFCYEATKIFANHRDNKVGRARANRASYVDSRVPIAAQILSLCRLDKMAVKIAKELELKNIHDVAQLTKEQLVTVDLIGDKIAERIIETLGIDHNK